MSKRKYITDLGVWNIYFLLSFLLYLKEYIVFNPLLNLGFACFLLLPINNSVARWLKNITGLYVGFKLLYFESFLPPLERLFSESSLVIRFNFTYLMELANRFVNMDLLALIIILLAVYFFISKYVRVTVLVMASILYLNIPSNFWSMNSENEVATTTSKVNISSKIDVSETEGDENIDLDEYLSDFYKEQAKHVNQFREIESDDTPFDLIFLHICSLSWDDLKYAKLTSQLPKFHFIFDSFNTAASYSGPATVRLLRSNCGQSDHTKLYEAGREECLLFNGLNDIGFEKEIVMNHDGHFDDFMGLVQKEGLNVTPLSLKNIPVPLKAFDSSPVYDDFAVLNRWLAGRQRNFARRTAVYYNTITLHDGNRFTDNRSRMSSTENYALRLESMLNDITEFMNNIEASGRRAMVVMVSEHGAAMRGDKMQVAGLREIPTPSITLVPAGIRLIGPEYGSPDNAIRIGMSTSYHDLITLLDDIISSNPFGPKNHFFQDYTSKILEVPFVSENAGTVVIKKRGKYFMKIDINSEWEELISTEE